MKSMIVISKINDIALHYDPPPPRGNERTGAEPLLPEGDPLEPPEEEPPLENLEPELLPELKVLTGFPFMLLVFTGLYPPRGVDPPELIYDLPVLVSTSSILGL